MNVHPVTCTLGGLDIRANVYTPASYDPAKQTPAVAVAHPNGGVKEQTAGLYGQRLAERGYITIAADAAFQGASGGQPGCVDKPAHRTEDIHAMADFIGQYPGVDAARLGLLGICGGGGHALNAAKTDRRFKAIATLSMFNSGRVRRNGYGDARDDPAAAGAGVRRARWKPSAAKSPIRSEKDWRCMADETMNAKRSIASAGPSRDSPQRSSPLPRSS